MLHTHATSHTTHSLYRCSDDIQANDTCNVLPHNEPGTLNLATPHLPPSPQPTAAILFSHALAPHRHTRCHGLPYLCASCTAATRDATVRNVSCRPHSHTHIHLHAHTHAHVDRSFIHLHRVNNMHILQRPPHHTVILHPPSYQDNEYVITQSDA